MTHSDLPGVRFAGRPVKPLALGLAIMSAVLVGYNLIDAGFLGASLLGDVVAAGFAAAAVLLTAGWVTGSQTMAETGLLVATGMLVTRSAFLLLSVGVRFEAVWLGLATAVMAGGAYLLEAWDER